MTLTSTPRPLAINKTGWRFDIDGDGLPDSYQDMLGQYVAWAPYFTTTLRKSLGTESPGRESHSDATLYLSLVILHTKYTGWDKNDFSVYA
jgi:hypothetical protein